MQKGGLFDVKQKMQLQLGFVPFELKRSDEIFKIRETRKLPRISSETASDHPEVSNLESLGLPNVVFFREEELGQHVGSLHAEPEDVFLLRVESSGSGEQEEFESGDMVIFPGVSARHKCGCKRHAVKLLKVRYTALGETAYVVEGVGEAEDPVVVGIRPELVLIG